MRRLLACFLLTFSSALLLAQSSFEVASIKPSDPNTQGIIFRNEPGGLNISGATIGLLIQQAYDVRPFQILGGPGWIHSERYDVVAKIGRPAAVIDPGNVPDQFAAMEQHRERLRSLLAERCRLKIHRKQREVQAYILVPAKGGPKLKESKPDESIPAPPDKGQERPRGAFMRAGPGMVTGQFSMDRLAQMLSQQLGRPVLDQTGLTGRYDVTLEWTPDPGQGFGPQPGAPAGSVVGSAPPRPDNPAPAEPTGPSIFAAIQEQLGLKLESQKAPVDMIVIENIERPSEN